MYYTYISKKQIGVIFRNWKQGKMKNKKIVMTAIAKDNIKDLYDTYFELRGYRGFVSGIAGVDGEVGNVDSIYKLTRE